MENPQEAAPEITYFDLPHTVSEDEIDAQMHVHNLRYLQWTLWAAGKHTKAIGWDSAAGLARGVGWVVREHKIQYRLAALAGDELVIRTWVHDLQTVRVSKKVRDLPTGGPECSRPSGNPLGFRRSEESQSTRHSRRSEIAARRL